MRLRQRAIIDSYKQRNEMKERIMSEHIDANNIAMHDGSLYDYNNGAYCGVLIKENVMRKLVKMQKKHLEDVKRLLMDESYKGNVFPSMWALHYPDGKQTVVTYIDNSADVESRIKNATMQGQPVHKPIVFIASSMDEAKGMADARFNASHEFNELSD